MNRISRVFRVSNVNLETEENNSLESYIREINSKIQNHLKDDKKCIFIFAINALGN